MFHLLKLLCRNGLNLKAKINIQLKSGYFLTFAKVLKKIPHSQYLIIGICVKGCLFFRSYDSYFQPTVSILDSFSYLCNIYIQTHYGISRAEQGNYQD